FDPLGRLLDRLGVGDVELDKPGVGAAIAQGALGSPSSFLVARAYQHGHALRPELARSLEPDSLVGPGDQSDLCCHSSDAMAATATAGENGGGREQRDH